MKQVIINVPDDLMLEVEDLRTKLEGITTLESALRVAIALGIGFANVRWPSPDVGVEDYSATRNDAEYSERRFLEALATEEKRKKRLLWR
jgi:hypothetical protein